MYVYACQSCGQVLERRQSFNDPPLAECEGCGGKLRRVLQPVGVIFRGSGFYSTDYRDNGTGAAAGTDGAAKDGESATPTASPSTSTPAPKESSPAAPASSPSAD